MLILRDCFDFVRLTAGKMSNIHVFLGCFLFPTCLFNSILKDLTLIYFLQGLGRKHSHDPAARAGAGVIGMGAGYMTFSPNTKSNLSLYNGSDHGTGTTVRLESFSSIRCALDDKILNEGIEKQVDESISWPIFK